MTLERNLGPGSTDVNWRKGVYNLMQGIVKIAHIDTGVIPHEALGWSEADGWPDNVHVATGRNYLDSAEGDAPPISDGRRSDRALAELIEYPDHGLKTLSVILSKTDRLRGVAPGAHVVPYRVANGPLFQVWAPRDAMGKAVRHAVESAECGAISISMGSPGFLPFISAIAPTIDAATGTSPDTRRAFDDAYERGVIVCAAAGQVIDRVVEPARFPRTIACGGFGKQGAIYVNYPVGGYAQTKFVDVWARAVNVNRAAILYGADGQPKMKDGRPEQAYAENDGTEDVSGTSYATPQVAAAAALWLSLHGPKLKAAFGGERWKIVEAFRKALRDPATGTSDEVQTGVHYDPDTRIRVLNIEKLLAAPPDLDFPYMKAATAGSVI